jgi:flagellar motor switch protein FliM
VTGPAATPGPQRASRRQTLAAIFSEEPALAERLPVLPLALERAASLLVEDLRRVSAGFPRLGLLGIETGSAADILAKAEGNGIHALLYAGDWQSYLLTWLERDLVFDYVDLVLGGDGSQPAYAESRALTRIEARIAATLIARLGRALESAFAPIAHSSFTPTGEAGRVNADVFGGSSLPVAIARFRLEAGSRGGELQVAIPRAVLNALRPALAIARQTEPARADPGWHQQMQHEITKTKVSLKAILEERLHPLADIAAFEVGQIIALEATPRSRVRVECNGEPLLWCEIGKSLGAYTLRVDSFIDQDEEFRNGILYG